MKKWEKVRNILSKIDPKNKEGTVQFIYKVIDASYTKGSTVVDGHMFAMQTTGFALEMAWADLGFVLLEKLAPGMRVIAAMEVNPNEWTITIGDWAGEISRVGTGKNFGIAVIDAILSMK